MISKQAIGCIADDFTGASDVCSFLVDSGANCLLLNSVPSQDNIDLEDVDVVVVALKIRSIKRDDAVQEVAQAMGWLDSKGIRRYYYKYCSTFDYIDPPYNTGNDFIYRDDFAVSGEEYIEDIGQLDDEGNRLFKNTDSNGRFHSDWCSMIYSRLLLARNLLAEEGIIFISIDDNEVHSLRKICDEVFGAHNYLNQFAWVSNITGRQISGCGAAKTLPCFPERGWL